MNDESTDESPLKFPKRFLWGVASSAHQYEGGADSQWTAWEQENAQSLATRASYQYDDLPSWGRAKSQAMSRDNYLSGDGNGHREVYSQDFKLLELMNMNAWRFSIEWSRVEPSEGQWDEAELQWYRDYIRELQSRGVEPVVTLFHFTLPRWFADKGGFEKRKNIELFERYTKKMLVMLAQLKVRYIITINEPDVYVSSSYRAGEWPPNTRRPLMALKVQYHLALAHTRIAQAAHSYDRRLKVAIAKNSNYFKPKDERLLSRVSSRVRQYLQDDYYLRSYVRHSDFIGVNYYFSNQVAGRKVENDNEKLSDLGWDMQPRDIQHVLERLYKKYQKSLLITENGLADAEDQYRKWWLEETIIGMNAAMGRGVPLIGYLHWSLLDNFEWDKGFWPRFGLVAVNYETMKRQPRASAIWYTKVVKKLRGL